MPLSGEARDEGNCRARGTEGFVTERRKNEMILFLFSPEKTQTLTRVVLDVHPSIG